MRGKEGIRYVEGQQKMRSCHCMHAEIRRDVICMRIDTALHVATLSSNISIDRFTRPRASP